MDATEQARINRWIGEPFREWALCYQKSIDGSAASTFHALCDNRGPTVTVIQLANGSVLGGYNSVSWSAGFGGYRSGERSFLFSLTNDQRFVLGYYHSNATYSASNYGPTFGSGHDVYVNSSMDLGSCNFPYGYSCDGQSNGPTDVCTQTLCGEDRNVPVPIDELEMWVHVD